MKKVTRKSGNKWIVKRVKEEDDEKVLLEEVKYYMQYTEKVN